MYHQKFFNLKIVQTKDLDNFFELFKSAKKVFFDTETSGLYVRHEGADYVVGYTFAFEDSVSKDVFYVPVRHIFEGVYVENDRFKFLTASFLKNFPDFHKELFEGEYYNVDAYDFAQRLKEIMERGGKEYIAHNITYDLHLLANEGIDVEKVFEKNTFQDTQIMVHTIDESVEKNLESVTKRLFHVEKSHYSDTIKTVTKDEKLSQGLKATQNASFQHVQISIGGQYSAEDVWFMKQMFPMLLQGLIDDNSLEIYSKCRIPFMKVLWKMERKGVKVDIDALDKMQELAEKEAENLKYKMFELTGVEFNPDSSQHLYEILFGFKKKTVQLTAQAQLEYDTQSQGMTTAKKAQLKKSFMSSRNCVCFKESYNEPNIKVNFGFKPVDWTDGGTYEYEELKTPKTGGEVLKKLLKQNVSKRGHEFIELLVAYKKLSKLISAFMIGLRECIYSDGKVHCSFNICGCLTGDTLIPTEKGLLPIGSIANDLEHDTPVGVETAIVNKDLEWENTRYIVKFEKVPVIKLTTALGMEIAGSHIHPIMACKYHNVKNNTRFRRYLGSSEGECWKKLEEINPTDHIVIPIGYNKFAKSYKEISYETFKGTEHCKKEVTLPKVLDEDLAEFLGIYYADGCLHDSNGSFSVVITNGNEDAVKRVCELSKKLFNVEAKVSYKQNSATICITAKRLCVIENALEMVRGCRNKVIPNIILQSPANVVKAFIKGMTLDSCVVDSENKTFLKFTVSNHVSAKHLQEILLNIGIVSSVRQDTSKTLNVFHVIVYNEWYEKFKNEIGFVESCKNVLYTRGKADKHNGYIYLDNKIYVKVIKKEFLEEDVYDFNVPNTHSFISMPCISHNTDSWRLSSQMPNMQQLPHPLEEPKEGEDRTYYDFWERFEIRKLFIAEEGYSFITADYTSLERYLTAHLSQDKVLCDILENNRDSHSTVAKIVFPELKDVPVENIKKEYPAKRQLAKKISFCLDYGGSAVAVARNLEIDQKTAQMYIDKYFEGFYGLHTYDQAVVKFAKTHGYVKTLGGHKRHLWDINSSDRKVSSYLERVAVNVLSQGSGADVTMFAQLDIDSDPVLKAIGAYMVMNIHDEVAMICPTEYKELCMERLKFHMENCMLKRGIHLTYNLKAVPGYGKSYFEAK